MGMASTKRMWSRTYRKARPIMRMTSEAMTEKIPSQRADGRREDRLQVSETRRTRRKGLVGRRRTLRVGPEISNLGVPYGDESGANDESEGETKGQQLVRNVIVDRKKIGGGHTQRGHQTRSRYAFA